MRLLPLALASALLLACAPAREAPQPAAESYRFPAEFEPHASIWLAWPTYENKAGRSTKKVMLDIIRALEGHVDVDLLVRDSAEEATIRALLDAVRVPSAHLRLHPVAHGDIWLRDMGPIFVKSPSGSRAVVDFYFNNWGYPYFKESARVIEDAVDERVAQIRSFEVIKTRMSSEGGDREFNGKGTLMATEQVERQRNPTLSLPDIEAELGRVLGVRHFVWLPRGIAEDDATYEGPLPGGIYTPLTPGGHIDEYARFSDEHTVLLGEVTEEEAKEDPIRAMSRERLEAARAALDAATDQDGKPFRILRVPMPEPLYDTLSPGDGAYDIMQDMVYSSGVPFPKGSPVKIIVSASYLNFLVTNGVVLMQSYAKEGRSARVAEKDALARRILADAFPGRTIIPLDAEAVNLGGGGIHCITQQEPASTP